MCVCACVCVCVCVCACSVMSDSSAIAWTVAHQAPLSVGFPRQEYFGQRSLGGHSTHGHTELDTTEQLSAWDLIYILIPKLCIVLSFLKIYINGIWLDGHEFEYAPGVGDGQGSLACFSHGVAKSQTRLATELNWNGIYFLVILFFLSQKDFCNWFIHIRGCSSLIFNAP